MSVQLSLLHIIHSFLLELDIHIVNAYKYDFITLMNMLDYVYEPFTIRHSIDLAHISRYASAPGLFTYLLHSVRVMPKLSQHSRGYRSYSSIPYL